MPRLVLISGSDVAVFEGRSLLARFVAERDPTAAEIEQVRTARFTQGEPDGHETDETCPEAG